MDSQNTLSFFAKLIETIHQGELGMYTFKDMVQKNYVFTISLDCTEEWVADPEKGVYIAEMKSPKYGEDSFYTKGFELYWNNVYRKLVFSITCPENVNVGMLKGISEQDPLHVLSFKEI
jgi:hypothetical protein